MLQCFISHCSEDLETIVFRLDKILSDHLSKEKYKIFCSSTSNNPLLPGTEVGSELKNRLKESKCMIAIVTDNYLRSPISLTELSSMWFTSDGEGIIPIVFSSEGENYLKQDFISNLVYLNALDKKRSRINAELMINTLKKCGFEADEESSFLEELTDFFTNSRQKSSGRSFIGSGNVYNNINRFCAENGIQIIQRGPVKHEVVLEHLSNKSEIYCVMTTGSSFVDMYSKEFLQTLVAKGVSIYMVIPNRNSDFCRDLAFIESPENSKKNLERLTMEFETVVTKLKIVIQEAEIIAEDKEKIGHVFLCPAYNLLRQTICLGKSGDSECWGWMTTTIPPARASGNTPTIVFEGTLSDEQFLGWSVYQHITNLIEVARKRNGLIDLNSERGFTKFDKDEIVDVGERAEIEKKWEKKYDDALKYMKKRQTCKNQVLIEIAAQHPLSNDAPGEEFAARLEYGFQLYERLTANGKKVSIYVPGSIHAYKGVADPISLSEAGCTYLKKLGVPEDNLFGDNENREYMGKYGVYNSCDECYVSAKLFNDYLFGEFHCVCSPNQVIRKQLFFLNFQIIPFIHTVPCDKMFHSLTDELFTSVPMVLYKYPNWSNPGCPIFKKTRLERMPEFKND